MCALHWSGGHRRFTAKNCHPNTVMLDVIGIRTIDLLEPRKAIFIVSSLENKDMWP